MKAAIIVGSHRQESQSSKVGKYFEKQLTSKGHESYTVDLAGNPFPLWDESIWAGDAKWKELWGPVSERLQGCDAAIVIAPEWGGMAPAGLKNFFLLLGKELAHKPGMLVGVSGSRGGSYPIAELRQSSYKNSFICYIPDHVIVKNVNNLLNDAEAASDDDKFIRGKIDYSLDILSLYAQGLKGVWGSDKLDFKTYPFGM